MPVRARRERVKLTYDKFNALLPVLPSFLPPLTPMALGHARYYYFHSFPHVCLSVCLLCLTVWLHLLTPSSPTDLFSDVFLPTPATFSAPSPPTSQPLSTYVLLVFCTGTRDCGSSGHRSRLPLCDGRILPATGQRLPPRSTTPTTIIFDDYAKKGGEVCLLTFHVYLQYIATMFKKDERQLYAEACCDLIVS